MFLIAWTMVKFKFFYKNYCRMHSGEGWVTPNIELYIRWGNRCFGKKLN